MNLLRSTFVAFCLTSSALAFAPQFTSKSLQRGTADHVAFTTQSSSSRLYVGIHEQSPSSISDEDIQKETMFRQVLKEVSMAKEYLEYLIDESGAGATTPEEEADESGPTMGEVLASQAAAGEVELLGGGGMMDAPSTSSETPKETQYKPSLRSDLGTTILLSGTADASLLSILNNNFFGQENVPNFEFGMIRALVDDTASAKKRAISREARYSGLLDKLVIEPSEGNVLPKATELTGVGSWIVQIPAVDAGSLMPQIAELAKGSDELKNVVVLVTGSTSTSTTVDGWDAVVGASADGEAFKCTMLSVGELYEGAKGGTGFYHVGKLADGAPTAKINTKKAYQLAAHALSLDCTVNEALTAFEYSPEVIEAVGSPYAEGELAVRDDDGNEIVDEFKDIKMEGRMVQACREVGFTPLVELDVMVGKGLEAYKAYLADPPNKENAFTSSNSKRDEEDEKIMAVLDAEIAKSDARKEAEAAEKKRIEVEGIAKEWAIKEYSLRMLVGDLDDSVAEKDFMISVWDEALAEASTTYDRIHSEAYIKQQERNEKEKVGIENKLFWDGMSPALRKKREKMVEKVKQQYMDLLSEEELEQIILSE